MTKVSEKQTLNENLQSIGKTAYESLEAISNINTNVALQTMEQQIAFGKLMMDFGCVQLELLASTRNYKDLLSAESKAIQELSENAEVILRSTLDTFTESKREVDTWMEQNIAKAASAAVVPLKKSAA